MQKFKIAFLLTICVSTVAQAATKIDQVDFADNKQFVSLPSGVTIAYREFGDPKGKALILVHGFTDNARSWSLVIPYIPHSYRIIAMDVRGHGKSSAPECCYAFPDLAYDVKLLMDKLNVDTATLIGHSLGSMISQTVAASYPERVNGVVLISSTATNDAFQDDSWLASELPKLTFPLAQNSPFMNEWYTNELPVDPEFINYEKNESAGVPRQVWYGVMSSGRISDISRNLSKIKAPTLVIHGSKDAFFAADSQAKLRELLPQSKFVEFTGAGHNVMWEKPQEVAAVIDEFLSKK